MGNSRASSERVVALDGLRGVAALIVVFGHIAAAFPGYYHPVHAFWRVSFWRSPFSLLEYTPLRLLVDGSGAVAVFFVLSGYVLALALDRGGDSYGGYVIKRVCRIYLPFLVVILFAAAVRSAISAAHLNDASAWFNERGWLDHGLTPSDFVAHVLMTGGTTWLDNPMWTLIHELRVSFIFPVLLILTRTRPASTLIGLTVVSTVAGLTRDLASNLEAQSWIDTASVLILFSAGAALYQHREIVRRLSLHGSALVAWAAALLLLIVPANWPYLGWCSMVGAVLLVALTVRNPPAVLAGAAGRALGRVSYSLYLIHMVVIQAVVSVAPGPLWLRLLLALGVVGIATPAAWTFIERPCQRLGAALGRRYALSLKAA